MENITVQDNKLVIQTTAVTETQQFTLSELEYQLNAWKQSKANAEEYIAHYQGLIDKARELGVKTEQEIADILNSQNN